jgi:hypothetical protein
VFFLEKEVLYRHAFNQGEGHATAYEAWWLFGRGTEGVDSISTLSLASGRSRRRPPTPAELLRVGSQVRQRQESRRKRDQYLDRVAGTLLDR